MANIPRSEHPNPQFYRDNWVNLNGTWDFEIDYGVSGHERGMEMIDYKMNGKITVPFCPESKLSGIEHKDFMNCVWYKRVIEVTEEQLQGRVIVHFGAVDHEATVYVNGKQAGIHVGGYVSFELDITKLLNVGDNVLTVRAHDDVRNPLVARGKQSEKYYSHECDYTRTTGIWQTVWLEFKPNDFVKSVKYYPNSTTGSVNMEVQLVGSQTLKAEVFYEGKLMGSKEFACHTGTEAFCIDLAETHLWEIGCGRLYDVVLTYGEDKVKSYFGLRSIRIDGRKLLINNKPVFLRQVLDQGFYPDGIYTAPSDEELKGDIERSMALGFNGARLHEKVFEPRFLYHCDRMGYIVWGEFPDWGIDYSRSDAITGILPQWVEEIRRDFNHPAIIGWCPSNEVYNLSFQRGVIETLYNVTKALDPTRIAIDASGGYHVNTDILDIHDYELPHILKAFYEQFFMQEDPDFYKKGDYKYNGGPVFISETGGIGFSDAADTWAYHDIPKTKEAFFERFKGCIEALLFNENICGFCYTQLTDIEQERNGMYTYDRVPKLDPKMVHAVLSQKAAMEE